jgi:hypothetical protein
VSRRTRAAHGRSPEAGVQWRSPGSWGSRRGAPAGGWNPIRGGGDADREKRRPTDVGRSARSLGAARVGIGGRRVPRSRGGELRSVQSWMATLGIWKLAGFDAPPLWFFEGAFLKEPSSSLRRGFGQHKIKNGFGLKGRKPTFGELKAHLRATDLTSSNIISRDI